MIGVTGTSGKTTTSYLCEAGLRAAGHSTGLIGGVEIRIGAELVKASLTTPEAPDLQALLAVMAERGVTAVAMEVSSHSLALGRVAGTRYGVAVFTNLSQDHLDFHAGFEDYFRAKAKLFTPAYSAVGVVNVADRYGRRLVAEASVPIVTFCADPASGALRAGGVARGRRALRRGRVHLPGHRPRRRRGGRLRHAARPVQRRQRPAARSWRSSRRASTWPTRSTGVASCPGVPGRLQRVPLPSGGRPVSRTATPACPTRSSTTRTSRARSRRCSARFAR